MFPWTLYLLIIDSIDDHLGKILLVHVVHYFVNSHVFDMVFLLGMITGIKDSLFLSVLR